MDCSVHKSTSFIKIFITIYVGSVVYVFTRFIILITYISDEN